MSFFKITTEVAKSVEEVYKGSGDGYQVF